MTQEVVWGGRFAAPPDPMMLELTGSLAVDIRLLPHDLRTTCAHAAALVRADLLEPEDAEAIMAACDEILRAWQEGTLPTGSHEDVHSLVEHELTARLGDVGRRIHAGRSRNDLVATDLRLWCKEQGAELAKAALALVQTLTDVADEHT
ncbi:MAG: argininosuccinate lyase, partial [Actinobacteria bacterium]|nr:argininosuccinate lyase [Actinomycetota bacterium]